MALPKKIFVMRHKEDGHSDPWLEAQTDLQDFSEGGKVAVYELVEKPKKMVIKNLFEGDKE